MTRDMAREESVTRVIAAANAWIYAYYDEGDEFDGEPTSFTQIYCGSDEWAARENVLRALSDLLDKEAGS